jgi:hypothetical protein
MSIHDNVFDLLSEMAEPTGPIAGWKAQVHIKQFLTKDDNLTPEQVEAIGAQIANRLKNCRMFMQALEAEQIIYDIERADNLPDLNEQLDAMYDVCDSERVWVR